MLWEYTLGLNQVSPSPLWVDTIEARISCKVWFSLSTRPLHWGWYAFLAATDFRSSVLDQNGWWEIKFTKTPRNKDLSNSRSSLVFLGFAIQLLPHTIYNMKIVDLFVKRSLLNSKSWLNSAILSWYLGHEEFFHIDSQVWAVNEKATTKKASWKQCKTQNLASTNCIPFCSSIKSFKDKIVC